MSSCVAYRRRMLKLKDGAPMGDDDDQEGPKKPSWPADAKDPTGAKAPGKPSSSEGFLDPDSGEEWVRNPNGAGYGWKAGNGEVWVPTGGKAAHGGEHWDVQNPRNGKHRNVYPGGTQR